jgi:hypothetical protein
MFRRRWQLGVTKQGLFGLVPPPTQKGDIAAVLYGANVPVILHPVEGNTNAKYRSTGSACIHGIMHGEALNALGEVDLRAEHIRLV